MKWIKIALRIFMFFITVGSNYAQIPKDIFRSPLEIPLRLAGNFCEIRSNHFHSGLDFKTQGKEGARVLAASGGHISRIKISSRGFGRVLYMDHPTGYTTVYAHLNSFNAETSKLVDSIQHVKEQYEIEIFPDSTQFVYEAGDFLGLSGNSGGSQAPHLHFEIRDRKSEEPLNPFMAGFDLTESIQPRIDQLAIYTKPDSIYVLTDLFQLNSSKQILDTICVDAPEIYVGYGGIDPDSASSLGIYKTSVFMDDSLIYEYQFDRVNFNDTKFVNAHIDYSALKKYKTEIQRCYKLDGNKCPIFINSGTGQINFNNTNFRNIKIDLVDYSGNQTSLNFVVKFNSYGWMPYSQVTNNIYYYDSTYVLKSKNVTLELPKKAFYESTNFTFKTELRKLKPKSKKSDTVYIIGSSSIAINESLKFTINGFASQKKLEAKWVLAELNSKNETTNAIRLTIDKNTAKASIRTCGTYIVRLDTLAPTIQNFQLEDDPIDSTKQRLLIFVNDNLIGVKKADAFINHNWQPCEFDAKQNALIIPLDANVMGPFVIDVRLEDYCENLSFIKNYLML
jgi:hypothetical protein